MNAGRTILFSASLKWLCLPAVCLLACTAPSQTPPRSLDAVKDLQATDFTSDQYYEPPHEQQIKIRLSGASASPLPDGAQDVRSLKIEKFGLDGKIEVVVRAPQCTYSMFSGEASSSGHFEMETGDGRIQTEGDGFLWRQSDDSLIISNHVQTVIKTGILKLNLP